MKMKPYVSRWALACCVMAATLSPLALAQELNNVEVKAYTSRDFKLTNGAVLPELTIAYETYGKLAPGGNNAVLITYGYTNTFHAAGRYKPSDPAPGNWDGLIGPGKAIDTNKYFVVSGHPS